MAIMLTMSAGAYAAKGGGNDNGGGGGDKVNNPWQPVDVTSDVCQAFMPAGIDISQCTEIASTTSGITYFCDTIDSYTVMCPTDKNVVNDTDD